MKSHLASVIFGACVCMIGCGSNADSPPGSGGATGGIGGALGAGGAGAVTTGGVGTGPGGAQSGGATGQSTGGAAAAGGTPGTGGAPASGGAGSSAGGAVGSGGAGSGSGGVPQGTGGAGGTGPGAGGTGASGGNNVTGSLGSTPLKPIVTALVSANGGPGETIIYLFTSAVTCTQISSAGWLPSIPAGTQVVEIVIVPATTTTGTFPVPGSEVNYANGGQLSLFETNANSGTITITKNSAGGVIEGSVTASYTGGGISGTFHAEFCATGQGY